MKAKNGSILNEISFFVDSSDVFEQIHAKRIEEHKTLKSILFKAPAGLSVKYASFAERIMAFAIDLIIVFALLTVLDMISEAIFSFYKSNTLQEIAMTVLILILYSGVSESTKSQATIGKMLLKIKVVDSKGKRLHLVKALLRSAVAMIPILPLSFGIWRMASSTGRHGWHDMLLNCYVIKS